MTRLQTRHPIRALAVGAIAVIGLAAGPLATPASAAPSPAGSAPSCVDFWTTGSWWKTFHVYNGCSYKLRLKILLNWHADSDCNTVQPGWEWDVGTTGQASLRDVVTC